MIKSIDKIMSKIGYILGLAGIIFFALSLFCTESLFDRIMLIICSLLLFVAGGLYIFIDNNKPKKKTNLFLYNPITKRERTIDELKFRDVCLTLDLFIPIYAYSCDSDVWFDKNTTLRYADYKSNVLVKLIYYRLLYIWIECASDNEYNRLGNLSKEEVDYIVDFLVDIGENEISSKLKNLSQLYNGNTRELRNYFLGKKEYLECKMLNIVIENIDEF